MLLLRMRSVGGTDRGKQPLRPTNNQYLYKPGMNFKRQRKLTSSVWLHFTMLEPDNDGNLWCRCNKCNQVYSADSKYGTGNLLRHAQSCVRRDTRDIGQLILSKASGSLGNCSAKFSAEIFRELLNVAIVKHGLPFQFVEYDAMRDVFSYLYPDVKFISRNTAKSDILKMFKREKEKLALSLQSAPGRISLTSGCWTSITTDGYISLTALYIDCNWVLQKHILNFSFMPPLHPGFAMCETITNMLQLWGIEKKIMSITLDNASANDTFVGYLRENLDLMCGGDYFHIRCCAHILNLVVQEGLKEVSDAIVKVRESVKYCKGSQARIQRFLDCVKFHSLSNERGLRQDVPTRWNSTYTMLESALFYRKAFAHFNETDGNYIHCPTPDEWSKIEKIAKFLKVFYEVTCAFSGSKYLTANLYFPNVLRVRLLLKEEMESNDIFMKKMAGRLYSKFEKYWADFSTIMAIDVILDPRYKFLVDWAYKKIYDTRYTLELESLKGKLFGLFDAYLQCAGTSNGGYKTLKVSKFSGSNGDCSENFMEEFDVYS